MRHRQSSVCFLRLEDQSIQPIHHGLIPLEEDRAGAQQDDGKAEDAHCGNVDPRGGGDAQQPCDQDVGVRGEECGTGVYKDGSGADLGEPVLPGGHQIDKCSRKQRGGYIEDHPIADALQISEADGAIGHADAVDGVGQEHCGQDAGQQNEHAHELGDLPNAFDRLSGAKHAQHKEREQGKDGAKPRVKILIACAADEQPQRHGQSQRMAEGEKALAQQLPEEHRQQIVKCRGREQDGGVKGARIELRKPQPQHGDRHQNVEPLKDQIGDQTFLDGILPGLVQIFCEITGHKSKDRHMEEIDVFHQDLFHISIGNEHVQRMPQRHEKEHQSRASEP